MHACFAINDKADKICLYKADGSMANLIPVPGMPKCGDSVVVDANRQLWERSSWTIVADRVQYLGETEKVTQKLIWVGHSIGWPLLTITMSPSMR